MARHKQICIAADLSQVSFRVTVHPPVSSGRLNSHTVLNVYFSTVLYLKRTGFTHDFVLSLISHFPVNGKEHLYLVFCFIDFNLKFFFF